MTPAGTVSPVVVATLDEQVVAREVKRFLALAGWPGVVLTLSLTQSSPTPYARYAPRPWNIGPEVAVLQGSTGEPPFDAVQVNVTLFPDLVTPVIAKPTLPGLSKEMSVPW